MAQEKPKLTKAGIEAERRRIEERHRVALDAARNKHDESIHALNVRLIELQNEYQKKLGQLNSDLMGKVAEVDQAMREAIEAANEAKVKAWDVLNKAAETAT